MSKAIVVYFSAQGHTKKIAERIAELRGLDAFEIQPSAAYSEEDLNYMSDDSRVAREYATAALRDIELQSTDVPEWSNVSEVILCYPIWYGIAAWPVSAFVKKMDWTEKRIRPIAVSHSSPAGESAFLLEDVANGGDWAEAFRFYQDATDGEIKDWAK